MAVARRWAYPRRPLRILWTKAIWHPHTAQESAAMRAAHLSNAAEDCAGRKAGAHWRRRLPPRRARTHCSVGQASRVWGIAPTPSGGASGRFGEKCEPRRPRTEKPLIGATWAGPTRDRTRTNAPATKHNSDGTATQYCMKCCADSGGVARASCALACGLSADRPRAAETSDRKRSTWRVGRADHGAARHL